MESRGLFLLLLGYRVRSNAEYGRAGQVKLASCSSGFSAKRKVRVGTCSRCPSQKEVLQRA